MNQWNWSSLNFLVFVSQDTNIQIQTSSFSEIPKKNRKTMSVKHLNGSQVSKRKKECKKQKWRKVSCLFDLLIFLTQYIYLHTYYSHHWINQKDRPKRNSVSIHRILVWKHIFFLAWHLIKWMNKRQKNVFFQQKFCFFLLILSFPLVFLIKGDHRLTHRLHLSQLEG